jgi:hypothetical protein
MRTPRSSLLAAIALILLANCSAADAATPTTKKAIWGPLERAGKSQFPIYRDLGVGIYQMGIRWDSVAPQRPADPTNPADPAYQWPTDIDEAVTEGGKNGIRVLVMLFGTPGWANGGKDHTWAATDPKDFADFSAAATKHYPGVRLWMVWGEPCRGFNFHPLFGEQRGRYGKPLTLDQQAGPRAYAQLLDGAYGAIKAAQPSDLVVGGNCFTGTTSTLRTDMSPLNWMRYMLLPNGKPPRMDLYGHNAISARRPDLTRPQIAPGAADFSDLDLFATWIDKYIDRPRKKKTATRIFISEWLLPTDHFGAEATFYVTRKTAASWTSDALRITRASKRIYSLGWFKLYDDPPNASGDEATYGLLDSDGKRKPAYAAFKGG